MKALFYLMSIYLENMRKFDQWYLALFLTVGNLWKVTRGNMIGEQTSEAYVPHIQTHAFFFCSYKVIKNDLKFHL